MGRRGPRQRSQTGSTPSISQRLMWVFDAAVSVCLLGVPLAMAGIREYGEALLIACSFVMGVTWAIQQILEPRSTVSTGPATLIGLLAIGLVWLQLQPLPSEWLAQLAPFHQQYLPWWGGDSQTLVGASGWNRISLTPDATHHGLVLLVACVVFFLTLCQRLQEAQQVDRLIRQVAIATVVMAVVGLLQVMAGEERFLFLFEHPQRSAAWPAKGTFTNQNHFAHFLALGIGPLLWWYQSLSPEPQGRSGRSRSRSASRSRRSGFSRSPDLTDQTPVRLMVGATIALVGLALLLSTSRGGMLVFLPAAAIGLFAVTSSWKSVLKLAVPVVLFLGATLAAFGADEVLERWQRIQQAEHVTDLSTGRFRLWAALLEAMPSFRPAGAGVGSHADVYPVWLSDQFAVRFSHAENGYLQVLLETGLPGFLLLLSGLVLCLNWTVRGWRSTDVAQRRRTAAVTAGIVASVLHSLVDFVWYIPGCLIVTLALMACLCYCGQGTSVSRSPATGTAGSARLAWCTACVLLLATLPLGRMYAREIQHSVASTSHWQAYRAGVLQIAESRDRDQVEVLNEQLDQLIQHLEMCVQADPHHAEAWTALAPLYLQRFEVLQQRSENQMTLHDIRNTVQDAGFESSKEMRQWLVTAFGENARDLARAGSAARRSLQSCPLRSEAYLVLTEIGFLLNLQSEQRQALIQQATLTRPHAPPVLYAAGLLAEDSGDSGRAWDIWRHAAALDDKVATQVISRHAELLSAEQLLERLQPGPAVYRILYSHMSEDQRPVVAQHFARWLADRPLDGLADGFGEWSQLATMLNLANRPGQAVVCLRNAVRLNQQDQTVRRRLARLLVELQQWRAARYELRWLEARSPEDEEILALLSQVEQSLAGGGQPGRTSPPSRQVSARSVSDRHSVSSGSAVNSGGAVSSETAPPGPSGMMWSGPADSGHSSPNSSVTAGSETGFH